MTATPRRPPGGAQAQAQVKATLAAPDPFGHIADSADRATRKIEGLQAALEALNGTEAIVTIRFAVNDDAVIDHPLLGDAATAEAALIAMAETGALGEGSRADLT